MATDFGSDFSCEGDLDPRLTVVSGALCLAQACVRRLMTPRGGLFYDADYGTDLRSFLGANWDERVITRAAETELLKDERVDSVRATAEFDGETARLTLSIVGAEGPFVLVVGVSALTVEMLNLRKP